MKKILALPLACAMSLSLVACGGSEKPAASAPTAPAADPVELQIGFTTAADPAAPYFYVATEMARILNEKSGGTVTLELFPNGQLGQEREMFEGMQMGTTEMAVMTNSYVSNFIPACGALGPALHL